MEEKIVQAINQVDTEFQLTTGEFKILIPKELFGNQHLFTEIRNEIEEKYTCFETTSSLQSEITALIRQRLFDEFFRREQLSLVADERITTD